MSTDLSPASQCVTKPIANNAISEKILHEIQSKTDETKRHRK
jgi:hypothetical protein